MIGRRNFLAGALAISALDAARAQTAYRSGPARIAILAPGRGTIGLDVFLAELARLGYAQGRGIELVPSYAHDDLSALPGIARGLAAARIDVIVAVSNPAILAARAATEAIPIVMRFGSTDALTLGVTRSIARPGANVTGIDILGVEADVKRFDLMREAMPGAQLGFLAAGDTMNRLAALGVAFDNARFNALVRPVEQLDYAAAIHALADAGVKGIVVAGSPLFTRDVAMIVAVAGARGLPTMCQWREMAQAGCLASFGQSQEMLNRRAAQIVARILDGTAPSDIPIEQATDLRLVVNLRTARALGLQMPPALLARADEVIE